MPEMTEEPLGPGVWYKDEEGDWVRAHCVLTQDALDEIARDLERRYAAGEAPVDIEEYRRLRDEHFKRAGFRDE
jgi:hypothetical protein